MKRKRSRWVVSPRASNDDFRASYGSLHVKLFQSDSFHFARRWGYELELTLGGWRRDVAGSKDCISRQEAVMYLRAAVGAYLKSKGLSTRNLPTFEVSQGKDDKKEGTP